MQPISKNGVLMVEGQERKQKMEDRQIVELYWQRDERAIAESDARYGRMLQSLSMSILHSPSDAEECVNDTWLSAWNAMPTDRPDLLGAYLSRITRNHSITRYRYLHAGKRSAGGDTPFEELEDCLPDSGDMPFEQMENRRLADLLNRFLSSLDPDKRIVFVRRYYYCDSVADLERLTGFGPEKIKSMLARMRKSLAVWLKREGF